MEKSRTQVADELLDLGNRDFSFSLSSIKKVLDSIPFKTIKVVIHFQTI